MPPKKQMEENKDLMLPFFNKHQMKVFLADAFGAEIDGLRAMLIEARNTMKDYSDYCAYQDTMSCIRDLSQREIEDCITYCNAERGGEEVSRAIHDLQDYASGAKTSWEGDDLEKQEAIEACKQFTKNHPEMPGNESPSASGTEASGGEYPPNSDTKSFKVCSAHQVYNMPNAQSK